jgi:hypothetical protein
MIIFNLINGGNDIIYRDINKSAEKLLGVKKLDISGKLLNNVFPDILNFLPMDIIKGMLIDILIDGKPIMAPPVQYHIGQLNPWFSHYLFKLPSGDFATYVNMIDDNNKINVIE